MPEHWPSRDARLLRVSRRADCGKARPISRLSTARRSSSAISTGHSGSLTTIHADIAHKAIDRLALMIMSVGINMNFEEVRRYCAASIDVVVQLGRAGIAQTFLPNEEITSD